MTLGLIFLAVFIIGPLGFRFLTAPAPRKRHLHSLLWFTAIMAIAGLALRFGLPQRWGNDLIVTASGIITIWFSWIGILAYGTQVLRQLDPGLSMRRWTAVLGAIGTTIPWFGLAFATSLAG